MAFDYRTIRRRKIDALNVIGCLDHADQRHISYSMESTRQNYGRPAGRPAQPAHRLCLSIVSSAAVPDRARKCDAGGGVSEATAPDREARARRRLSELGLAIGQTFCPVNFLAANSSVSRSPGRWSVRQACCFATSRPAISDSKTSANLLDLLEQLNKEGLTLVIVTHDENVANRARRRVHIIDGRLTDVTIEKTTPRARSAARNRPPRRKLLARELRFAIFLANRWPACSHGRAG